MSHIPSRFVLNKLEHSHCLMKYIPFDSRSNGDREKSNSRQDNNSFIRKAPADVGEAERKNLKNLKSYAGGSSGFQFQDFDVVLVSDFCLSAEVRINCGLNELSISPLQIHGVSPSGSQSNNSASAPGIGQGGRRKGFQIP